MSNEKALIEARLEALFALWDYVIRAMAHGPLDPRDGLDVVATIQTRVALLRGARDAS